MYIPRLLTSRDDHRPTRIVDPHLNLHVLLLSYLSLHHRPVDLIFTMSRALSSSASTSSSNFQSFFNAALKAYEKKTKKDLLAHPLAAQLQACKSPSDILAILQEKVNEFDQSRSADERLSQWLNPTINVLYSFSATLGAGVGLVGTLMVNLSTSTSCRRFRRYSRRHRSSSRVLGYFFWWASSLIPIWRWFLQ